MEMKDTSKVEAETQPHQLAEGLEADLRRVIKNSAAAQKAAATKFTPK
jgi:hypothetical protein